MATAPIPAREGLRFRLRAALWHSLGSAGVALLALALVFFVWYPWPYALIAGGLSLFQLIVLVDVVTGPLVTFAVFDHRKRRRLLQFDLAVIVLLQCAALSYGLHTLYVARPVALALETDRFRVVSAVEVATEELSAAPEGLRSLPLSGPRLLRTEPPSDPKEMMEAVNRALAGQDLAMRPRYWRAWDDTARRQAREGGRALEGILRLHPGGAAVLDEAVRETGVPREHLRYLPLLARQAEWVVLVDAREGRVAGFAPLTGD